MSSTCASFNNNIKRKPTLFSIAFAILLFCCLLFEENAFLYEVIQGRWVYYFNAIIILFAFFDISLNIKIIKKDVLADFGRFLFPYIILIIYSIILCVVQKNLPISNVLTAGLFWVIPILMALGCYIEMGEKSIKLAYAVVLLNYTAVVIKCIYVNGFDYLLHISTYTDNYGSLLEVHPIGLALPLFLLFFYFEFCEKGRKLDWRFWLGVVYTLMCGKRIAILGLILVIFVYHFLRNRSERFERKKLRIFMFFVLIVAFTYLFMVKYGVIALFVKYLGMNSMTRLETWRELGKCYTISPLYFGKGIGYCLYFLKDIGGITINGYLNTVGDVHNDILKTYIDVGFVPFIFFTYYLFVGNLRYFLKKKLTKTGMIYFILILYTAILMFTDNVMRYDLYLFVLYSIPVICKNKYENGEYHES